MSNSGKPIEFSWLIRLRWFAVLSQVVFLFLIHYFFNISLSFLPIGLIFVVAVVSNFLLSFFEKRFEYNQVYFGSILFIDIILLFLLLYFTGGPFNPFSVFFLMQVALASIMLSSNWVWFLTFASIICFALLFPFHQPLPILEHAHHHSASSDTMSLHLYGMLLAFILTALLIAYFLSRLTSQLNQREMEIRKFREQRMNNQRLASLATLSAGAAHELSSPLATIAIISSELDRKISSAKIELAEVREEARLISSEINRCRNILDGMGAKSGQLKGEVRSKVIIREFIHDLQNELTEERSKRLAVGYELTQSDFQLPVAGLRQALLAILSNAFDASSARGEVRLQLREDDSRLHFYISDNGMGISDADLVQVLEPFFTTKGGGMGLGLFLVKLFVETWEGNLFLNSILGSGTEVHLEIPLR